MKLIFIVALLKSFLFASFSGIIIDNYTSQPIHNAAVSDPYRSVKSDENGSFAIDTNATKLPIKACGYRPYTINIENNETLFKLQPLIVKALYLSFWRASNNNPRLKELLNIIDNSEINTVVVDVKNEYGSTSYKTSFDLANSYGAHKKRTNRNIQKFISTMKSRNVYTIARIVTFKDELQASNNPEYAVKKPDGTIWRNHDEMAWVDPYDKRAHDYTLTIAEEAAKVGFDEINFDYIRFPAKSGLVFSKKNTQQNRIKAIGDFLTSAKNRLRKYGVFISADTYGNVCWSDDDNNIGQTVTSLAEHVDYLSPMLYPSSFASGSFYFDYPSEHPHAVVYRSIKNITDRIEPSRIRPWLQYFKDYTKRKKSYRKFEISEQIRAAEDINASGWMMWSPSSRYHLNYFRKED